MLDLPYEKIRQIQQSITVLDNLVGVFSQKNGSRLLQVFNSESPPALEEGGVRAISLRELPERDMVDYDGPVVGFTALDFFRGDLMTKGPWFYALDKIFLERGETTLLYHTQANLSVEIMRRMREYSDAPASSQRRLAEARALWLTLPMMLADRDCNGLVAVLPVGELNRFIFRKSCRFAYTQLPQPPTPSAMSLEDLPSLSIDSAGHWAVALEEAAQFNPSMLSARFLELRNLLRDAGKGAELQATRLSMSRELLKAQERMHAKGLLAEASQPYLSMARDLMVEYWLAQDELEDLVAFYPHNDFRRFMETGDALRVYRVLEESTGHAQPAARQAVSLTWLLKDGLPPEYGEIVYALPLLQDLPHRQKMPAVQPLGDLFWKIGQMHVLARTLWLLSHDVQNGQCGSIPSRLPELSNLIDSIQRACFMYSLLDPWRWRQGRWRVYLSGCYRTAQSIIKRASEDLEQPYSHYYQALNAWYNCFNEDKPEQKIRDVLEHLREFERAARERQDDSGHLRRLNSDSRQLIEVAEALLRLPVSGQVLDARRIQRAEGEEGDNITEGLRRAACFNAPLPLLSIFFIRSWEFLLVQRQKRQQLYARERDIDRLIRQLKSLMGEIKKEQHRIFAPAHEQAILQYAYRQEIEHVETLLRELETAAKLTVSLLNPWVDLHDAVNLTLEISNLGRVEAEGLEIVLEPSRGFQLLDESPVREIKVLREGDSCPVQYHIRPTREDAELRVEYSFNDRRGQVHKDKWTTRLTVRNMDEEPFQVKVNRYQFGRPIQEPTEFYGRRSELENILSQLIAGGKQNLLLRGPRRMGKTSLLYMLRRALVDPDTRRFFKLPVSWDAQLDRVHPVFMSLHSFDLTDGGVAVHQFFRTLLERVSRLLAYPDPDLELLLAQYERREKEVGAVNAALEQINRVLNCYPQERIAVLLDEYDEVYRPESGNLDRHLREFVSAEQRLTWIIASTVALFREAKTISSPWFNVFSIIELSRLSDDAAVSLVEIPCRQERVFWRSDAVLTLLSETGQHPAFTQLFCAKVISHLNSHHTNYVLDETILTVADEIVDEQETANSHFEFYWQDANGIGQLILLVLDDQEAPLKRDEILRRVRSRLTVRFGDLPGRRIQDPSGDPIAWQELKFKEGIEFVEKIVNTVSLDDQRRYVFTVPLFQRWLRRRRRHQDLMAEVNERIRQEMEQYGLAYP